MFQGNFKGVNKRANQFKSGLGFGSVVNRAVNESCSQSKLSKTFSGLEETLSDVFGQNEKLNHFHEKKKLKEKSYQEYKSAMMKKHGFDSWEQAAKDKDFMDALDRGWNGEGEEGKDGLNEAKDYTSALSIYFDGKGARIDMFMPDRNSNGWKSIGTEKTRSTEETIDVLKRLTSYGRVSVSTKGKGDEDSVSKVIAYLNTLKNIN